MVRVVLTGLLLLLLFYPVGRTAEVLLKRKHEGIVRTLIFGAVWAAALFQAVGVPAIFLNVSTKALTVLYVLLLAPEIVYGCVCIYRDFKNREKGKRQIPVLFLLLLIPIFFQAYSSAASMHVDSDDAEVVSLVTDAVQNNRMLRSERERGGEAPLESNLKRAVSPYAMAEAAISLITGLHPAIVCHTLMPFVLIPLCYAAFFCLGKELFPEEDKKVALFMGFLCLIYLFSSYSIKNGGYFFLVRTWQGKAMMQPLLLPVLIFMTLDAVRYCGERNRWVTLFAAALGGCLLTNMSFIAGVFVIGAGAIAAAVRERRFSPLLYGLFSASPCFLYGGIFAEFLFSR